MRGIFTVSKVSGWELGALFAALRACVTAGEFLDAARGIDEFLLAGEEGMARCADTHFDVALGGPCVVNRTARTRDVGLLVIGMNICFHGLEKGVES